MRRGLPARRSQRWLFAPPLVSLGVTALMAVLAAFLLPSPQFNYPGLLVFNLVVGSAIALAGWLGARFVVLLTSCGWMIGLGLMFKIWTEGSGWEALVGGFTMASFLGIGFLLGLVVELGVWIYRRRKQQG